MPYTHAAYRTLVVPYYWTPKFSTFIEYHYLDYRFCSSGCGCVVVRMIFCEQLRMVGPTS